MAEAAAAAARPPAPPELPVLRDCLMGLAAGEARIFNIFEPRYKLMVKEAIDHGRPILLVGSRDDAVGALCRVVSTDTSLPLPIPVLAWFISHRLI